MNKVGLIRFVQSMWIAVNERWLNISTADRIQHIRPRGWWRGPSTGKARHQDNCAYGTPDYYYVYKIGRLLRLGVQDVIYDIGAGKGRILCVFSRRKLKKCVGIELMEEYCEIARSNAQRVRGRRSPIEIRCEDAAIADMSDGTVYFLFNPFGFDTMRDVLANIEKSLGKNPRPIRIVYYNAAHRKAFDDCQWLRRSTMFSTFNGLEIDFYESL